jgi:glycosidase
MRPLARWPRWTIPGAGLLVAVAVTAIVLALLRQGPGPTPPVALEPDLAPLAVDGRISEGDLAHDSRDDTYRVPFGAVPAGTTVRLRLRAAAGDLTDASVRLYDALADAQAIRPMQVVARDARGGEHGYDYWELALATPPQPTVIYYRFIVRDGAATRYLEDDQALDGGPGDVLPESADASWQLVTYDPDYAVPDWVAGATVYQVFPDRFANGDPANDPSPDAVPGTDGAARFRYGDVYGNPVLVKAWDQLPEGYCRAYQQPGVSCDEEPLGRDFFGGDLAGITEHLPALADLGVTVLYLNPIFAAPSNHRYDTSDYFTIDPDLGTREDFDAMVAKAHELGIRVVLDGVFNHTSSDSPFFDRSHRFPEVGACEAVDSPWHDWYTFSPGPPAKCFDGQTYEDWFGFDTLAVLTEATDVVSYFNGTDGVVRHWIDAGIDGWRLDVMNELSHGFLRALRKAAKDANPDALVLGEEWNDASPWLLGTEADGVMNYRFRRAVIGLVNGDTPDLDGSIDGLTPSAFASAMEGVHEDYPEPAWQSLLNLVDSHDTTRILWTLTPGAENPAAKEDPVALEAGKAKLRQVAALQLTWPGMASIYYGDEVGLSGQDDPDDRRPYPWGAEDAQLRAFYAGLATLRRDSDALRNGDLRFLLADDDAGVLAFGRRTDAQAAITVLNLSDAEQQVSVPVAGWLPDGTVLDDVLGAGSLTAGATVTLTLPARGSAVLITADGTDLRPPAAPTRITAEPKDEGVLVHWGALDWDAVPDAAGYVVWRSLLTGGGFSEVGRIGDTSFMDTRARPGTRYVYAVTSFDASGNESPRSLEATALRQLVVADARLVGPAEVAQPFSAVEPAAEIAATVRIDGYSAADGPTVGVLAQVGFGPAGSDPLTADTWSWWPMTFDADTDGADRYAGSVRPEEPGTHAVAMRVSTDGGATWQLADRDGITAELRSPVSLSADPTTDTQPPPPPADVAAGVVSASGVHLVWSAVSAEDLLRYEVLRAEGDGDFVAIGRTTSPDFWDEQVRSGGSYRYAVLAQDTSYNRSGRSNEVVVSAESREVAATFVVHVPESTPPGDTVYIAGDFQGWDPGATPMEQVDATTWSITITFSEGAALQYKFTRGSWDAVEKDDGCGEIPNREATIVFGTDGTQALDHLVGKWRDVDQCG